MLISLLTAIHVTAVVLWIGGVAFVTIIVFPMLLRMDDPLEMVLMFHRIENKFALHAKIYVAITGATGFWIMHLKYGLSDFFKSETFGISSMLAAWTFYLLILTFEKKLFAKIFDKPEKMDAKKVFGFLTAFHWVVLGVSLFAVFAGVAQGH